jgi:sporulation protein YlmC with PRC-barrel domain
MSTTIKHDQPALSRRAIGFLSAATLSFIASSGVAHAQAVQLVAVDVKGVGQGYQVSKLLGKAVQNDKNEKIGALEDLIITRDRSLFGIVQVGGFLGVGGHLIAVPYDSLDISDDGRKIVLAGATKEAVGKLPEFMYKK